MALEPFAESAPLTMGVELEIQLINRADFDLTDASTDLLHLIGLGRFPGDVKPEITESMVEVSTHVHKSHGTLLAQLGRMRDALVSAGDRLNVAMCGGGSHPFQRWFRQKIVARPRFQEISGLYGYLAKQFTVFGQHVHIGCESADEALLLLHALNRYIPQFIALSASSPFSQGVDTLFDSSRLNSVFAFPLSGRAPFLLKWSDFETAYFAKMARTGIVHSMKDFYWDIRPKPEFGTIELRVCDTPLTVERAAALACYLQALCHLIREHGDPMPEEDDYLVYNFNRFQACRFGLDGQAIHPKTHEPYALRDDVLATLERLRPAAAALGSTAAMEHIRRIAEFDGNDAAALRAAYHGSGSIQGSVASAVEAFRKSTP